MISGKVIILFEDDSILNFVLYPPEISKSNDEVSLFAVLNVIKPFPNELDDISIVPETETFKFSEVIFLDTKSVIVIESIVPSLILSPLICLSLNNNSPFLHLKYHHNQYLIQKYLKYQLFHH